MNQSQSTVLPESAKRKISTPQSCFNSKIGKFVNVNQSTILPSTGLKYVNYSQEPLNIDNTIELSKDNSMHNTLLKSFVQRQSLRCNDNSMNGSMRTDLTNTNDSTWSVHRKSKSLRDIDCLGDIQYFESINNTSEITQNKLIKYRPGKTLPLNASGIGWKNPVLGTSEQNVPSVTSSKVVLSRNNFDRLYSSFRFNKEMLQGAKVMGQVDDKFIACLLPVEEHGEKVLVLIDQHAAHERIRLEKLLKQVGYYEPETCKENLKSQLCTLSPPAEMFFMDSNIDQLLHFTTEFHKAGIDFTAMKIKHHSSSDSSYRVLVSSVPSIFVNVCQPQSKAKGTSINVNLLKEYLLEQSKMMQTCASKCTVVSPVIFKVLASYACHGAIKFGDPLKIETCIKIVKELSLCRLPFQCAHGRPSIAPLIRLSMLRSFLDGANSTAKKKPNLQKLKQGMKQ